MKPSSWSGLRGTLFQKDAGCLEQDYLIRTQFSLITDKAFSFDSFLSVEFSIFKRLQLIGFTLAETLCTAVNTVVMEIFNRV